MNQSFFFCRTALQDKLTLALPLLSEAPSQTRSSLPRQLAAVRFGVRTRAGFACPSVRMLVGPPPLTRIRLSSRPFSFHGGERLAAPARYVMALYVTAPPVTRQRPDAGAATLS